MSCKTADGGVHGPNPDQVDPETCTHAEKLKEYDRLLEWLADHALEANVVHYNQLGTSPAIHHQTKSAMEFNNWHIQGTNVSTCLVCLSDFLSGEVTQPKVKSYA